MLDIGFVRNNLTLVEEKLRARGADPAALLGDFHSLDARRREAITQAEHPVQAFRSMTIPQRRPLGGWSSTRGFVPMSCIHRF